MNNLSGYLAKRVILPLLLLFFYCWLNQDDSTSSYVLFFSVKLDFSHFLGSCKYSSILSVVFEGKHVPV